jgi:hypothetical protein
MDIFEYLHSCQHSEKEIVVLKLDFEKAFDRIEHTVILDILTHKGFGLKWISWVEAILCSGSSAVLLNGVTGKSLRCRRGVRQGGIGILNIQTQNEALILKHLHKFFNSFDLPWVHSFIGYGTSITKMVNYQALQSGKCLSGGVML